MAMPVLDRAHEEQIRAERAELGIDRYDEVWDGVYLMSPLADVEHQLLVARLTYAIQAVFGLDSPNALCAGVNVSDRAEDWAQNYRIPDVAVFLEGTTAILRGTHWQGGPDFAVEITSEDDRSREKLPFYAKVGVRELLLVDREPWALELYRLREGQLILIGRSTLDDTQALASEVLPLTFRISPGNPRPRIDVRHRDGREWSI
jgi:Uma2 family endonuclease